MILENSLNDERLRDVIAHLRRVWLDPLIGLVAAGIYDGPDRFAIAASQYAGRGRWRHAERIALEEFVKQFGAPRADAVAVTTLSPCTHQKSQSRLGPPCAVLLVDSGIRHFHAGAIDQALYPESEAAYAAMDIRVTVTKEASSQLACERLARIFSAYGSRVNEDLPGIKRELPPP